MNRPRRIVLVQAGLGAGGAEKIVHMIARHRLDQGDAPHVLAFDGHPARSYFPYPPGIAVSTLVDDRGETAAEGRFAALERTRWLTATLSALKPDMVISFLTKVNVRTLIAAQLAGLSAPIVISERNNPIKQNAHPAWRAISSLVSGRATALVMQTKAARAILPPHLQARSVVIPNPCAAPSGVASEADGADFVAVGRLDPQKGFDLLVDAFAAPDLAGARLTIWGEGPERPALEAQIRALGLTARIALPGCTTRPGAWIDPEAIFVMSSRFEGFPNALAEAMSAGMASISSDCDWGPSELIRDGVNGVLIANEDRDALVAAMARLYANAALRQRLGDEARQMAQVFSTEAVLAQWDAVIDGSATTVLRAPRRVANALGAHRPGAPRDAGSPP